MTPSSRLSLSLRTRRHSCQKLKPIGDIDGAASAKGISGGGIAPQKLRREHDRIARRARLVVGDVEDAGGRARQRGIDRLRDVVDMDAIEDLAGLDDAPRIAARDLHQRVAPRSINAGEPQDGDGDA